jgi:hypothetical protein
MDEAAWKQAAKSYNGVLFSWVDQGEDTALQAANSKGVCFAMAVDFIKVCLAGKPGITNFTNDIKQAAAVSPGTNRIPQKYIIAQNAAQADYSQYRTTILQLYNQLQNDPTRAPVIEQVRETYYRTTFGPDLNSVVPSQFIDNFEMPMRIFEEIQDKTQPGEGYYFFVSMRGASSGHAIAFGIRPDLSLPLFPAVYEYFDANLGLFFFKTEQDLKNFFSIDVWIALYGSSDYNKFELCIFNAQKGRR